MLLNTELHFDNERIGFFFAKFTQRFGIQKKQLIIIHL
jgi:hypothetical protein